MKTKKILTWCLRFFIGLILIVILINKIDATKIIDQILNMDLIILPLFLLLFPIVFLATALNIKFVLDSLGEKIKTLKVLKNTLIAQSIGSFLPGRLGEVSVAYLLKKEGINYGKSLLALIIDKIATFSAVSIFSICAFFIFFEKKIALELSLGLVMLMIAACFCLMSNKIREIIRKFILRKYACLFAGFSKGLFYIIRKKKSILVLAFLIKVTMMVSLSLIIYLLLIAFGADVSFLYILIIHSVGTLSAQIPISIAGLGIRESIAVYMFSQSGVDPAVAGAVYLMMLAFSYLITGTVLIYYSQKIRI